MTDLYNPFLMYGYHSPDYFCDRIEESNDIMEAIRNERNITLVSPRRMGKTGLIHNVFYKIKEQRTGVPMYMDILATQNLKDFVDIFAETVFSALESDTQRLFSKIGKVLTSCRPTLSIDPVTGTPELSLNIEKGKEESTLKDVFAYLAETKKSCIIAIDEFQQIVKYPERGVEAMLRSYIQFIPNVRFIFSGSKQHLMQEMFLSAKRPFYQSTQILSIGEIDREEYYKFANHFFNSQRLSFNKNVFCELYDLLEGHTWYIQAILNRLYGYGKSVDSSEQYLFAINRLVDEYEYGYQLLLSSYTSNAVNLIIAIAREGYVKEINSGRFIAEHNLVATSSVNTSLTKLLDNEIVYFSNKGYMLYDRLMSIWIRKYYKNKS